MGRFRIGYLRSGTALPEHTGRSGIPSLRRRLLSSGAYGLSQLPVCVLQARVAGLDEGGQRRGPLTIERFRFRPAMLETDHL
ncbi:MAG: hypothetical protein JWN02_524, partial [Acidobacteria bacterium]|nr:hypothetical protein [Acidobacteriota bacterium]